MMKKMRVDRPGEWKEELVFTEEGEVGEIRGIVEAMLAGEYKVKVVSDHRSQKTRGKIKIKGVVANGARVEVSGLVKIAKGAQGTEDFLEVRMLVLDEESSAVVEPKLEIEANDVRASHAASVSQIDGEQVYYLMSRGISNEQAKGLIVSGFLKEMQ